MAQMDTEFSGDYRSAGLDPNSWDNQSSDPDLSDILDQVIEFVPDDAIAGNYFLSFSYSLLNYNENQFSFVINTFSS